MFLSSYQKIDRNFNWEEHGTWKYFCHLNISDLNVMHNFSKFHHIVNQNIKSLTLTPTSFLKKTCFFCTIRRYSRIISVYMFLSSDVITDFCDAISFSQLSSSITPFIHGTFWVWHGFPSFKYIWYSCNYVIIKILDNVVRISIMVSYHAEKILFSHLLPRKRSQ